MKDYNVKLSSSRQMVEQSAKNEPINGQYEAYMFLTTKFVLMVESIIAKDSENSEVYFDNIKNKKYIPIFLSFYREMMKNSDFDITSPLVTLKEDNGNNEELKKAICFLKKIKDSIVHGKSDIDSYNECLIINNSGKSKDGTFRLSCKIPFDTIKSLPYASNESYPSSKDQQNVQNSSIKKRIIKETIRQIIKKSMNSFYYGGDYEKYTGDTLNELKTMMRINKNSQCPNEIIALYNYMLTLFAEREGFYNNNPFKIYSPIDLEKKNPLNLNSINIIENKKQDLLEVTKSINKICNAFNKFAENINQNDQSIEYKKILYQKIYDLYYLLKKCLMGISDSVVNSIRNATSHGNVFYTNNNEIYMFDTKNKLKGQPHLKILANPQVVYNTMKQLESGYTPQLTLGVFLQQLENLNINKNKISTLFANMNKVSLILWGTELNPNDIMENKLYNTPYTTGYTDYSVPPINKSNYR